MRNKIILSAAAAVFLLSLAPIIITGLHARMSLDDYAFAASSLFSIPAETDPAPYTERSVRFAVEHGTLLDVPRAVFRTVADNYRGWQGTFSAIAAFALHPAVLFGEAAYPLTMVFTLLALIAATGALMKTILREHWALPSLILLFATIQWLPSLPNAFFWWNGGTYYTMFYSVMLLSIALKIRLHQTRPKRMGVSVALIAGLDFFLSGGNFVTALLTAELNVLFLLFLLVKKAPGTKLAAQGLFTAVSILGLLLSALAPGNAVRQAIWAGLPAPQAVLSSLTLALKDVAAWTSVPLLLLLLAAIPLMWRAAGGMKGRFPYPGLVLLGSFLLFASQNAPPLYGMGIAGEVKLRNIVYYAYLWFLFGNTFYLLGWFRHRLELRGASVTRPGILLHVWSGRALSALLGIAVLVTGIQSSAFLLCVRDLQAGRPQQFLVEYNQRLATLTNPEARTVEITSYSAAALSVALIPWMAHGVATDLTVEPGYWINRAVAQYYGKDAVVSLPRFGRAAPNPSGLVVGGTRTELDAYLIHFQRYVRLEAFAYAMGGAFDLTRVDAPDPPDSADPDLHDGLLPTRPGEKLATLHGDTLLFDGAPAFALSYVVDGEVLFRLQDLIRLADFRVERRQDRDIWLARAH